MINDLVRKWHYPKYTKSLRIFLRKPDHDLITNDKAGFSTQEKRELQLTLSPGVLEV